MMLPSHLGEGKCLIIIGDGIYSVWISRWNARYTVRLHVESLKAKASLVPFGWQERMMRGYAVEAVENFVLLDEIAVEACNTWHVPLGTSLGPIELMEMSGLAIKMFAWAYYSPTVKAQEMIEAGDTVTIIGEEGVWEVDMAGNGTDIVRIIKNRDASTWRMISRDHLVLVAKPKANDSARLIPRRSILDQPGTPSPFV